MIPIHKADGSLVATEVIGTTLYAVIQPHQRFLSAADLERMATGLRKLTAMSSSLPQEDEVR